MDPNGIYFILTSPDVTETSGTTDGFCKTFCGFHTFATLNNGVTSTDIKVAFVGDPATQCPARPGLAGCSAQALSPNGNEGADAMSSVIAHELNEAITDPEINAWFHIDGSGEVGDLCNTSSAATTFGPTFTSLNGAHANMVLSGRQFLIQSNWLNSGGGFCAMGFNAQTPSGLTFVPVPPCRVADTRNSAGAFGGPFMAGNARVNSIFLTALATSLHRAGIFSQCNSCSARFSWVPYSISLRTAPPAGLNAECHGWTCEGRGSHCARRNKRWFVFLCHP